MHTVIIVEDEEEIREGLKEVVPWEDIGFQVVASFASGNEAISYLNEHNVDVIITDIMMDDGSGIDVAEFLYSKHRKDTVIIFYTAYKDFSFAQQGIKYGIRHYITKDMGYDELLSFFRNLYEEIEPSGQLNESGNIISMLMKYLEENMKTATLRGAARAVSMNPNYLSSFVKEHTGIGFRKMLADIRIKKAAELLCNPSLSVNDVCKEVGYFDGRSFSRNFKEVFGYGPGEYRKKVREGK